MMSERERPREQTAVIEKRNCYFPIDIVQIYIRAGNIIGLGNEIKGGCQVIAWFIFVCNQSIISQNSALPFVVVLIMKS